MKIFLALLLLTVIFFIVFFKYKKKALLKEKIRTLSNRKLTSFREFENGLIDLEILDTLNRLKDFPELQNVLIKIKEDNDRYIEENMNHHFFSDEKYNQLDSEQRRAVVDNNYASLVIAGAGSGKTSVVTAKVHFLISELKISPEKIAIITFTNKATAEIKDRVKNENVQISTIHSFAKNIIVQSENIDPTRIVIIQDNKNKNEKANDWETDKNNLKLQLIKKAVEQTVSENEEDFFKFNYSLSRPIDSVEWIEIEKAYSNRSDKIRSNFITLNGFKVKSRQEQQICDYLFQMGVTVEYEPQLVIGALNLRPDFYLPDYDIYIEHFALDKKGKAPQTFTQPEKYEKRALEKIHLYKEKNIKMIVSYSYQFDDNSWQDFLTDEMVKVGITFKPRSFEEIKECLKDEDWQIHKNTFALKVKDSISKIAIFKKTEDELLHLNKLHARSQRERDKTTLFLKMLFNVFRCYNKLKEQYQYDYNDLVVEATTILDSKTFNGLENIEYLIVDEFQDTSLLLFDFINAFFSSAPNCKFFAVGDDWQAIYKFNGGQISLMSAFEKKFPYSSLLKISTNYRSNANIVSASKFFIEKNSSQISKDIKSFNNGPTEELLVLSFNQLEHYISSMKNLESEKIFFLYRSAVIKADNEIVEKKLKQGRKINYEFHTIHGSKGLQAETVFLINVGDEFPGENINLIDYLFQGGDQEPIKNAEERRLMYVAMTRAKKRFVVLVPNDLSFSNLPLFVQELLNDGILIDARNQF